MKAVCNTSPQILLAKIGRLHLLQQLYREILIPVAVLEEVRAKPGREAQQLQTLIEEGIYQLHRVAGTVISEIPAELGSGEREVIALAIEKQADLVILDDLEGRRIAREKGLIVTGTIGLLVEARKRGLIPSIRGDLDRLIEAGMWLDEIFYHRILREFGE